MDELKTPVTRILLLTHSRTASHVLERMLSKQPACAYQQHPFKHVRTLRRQVLFGAGNGEASLDLKKQLLSSLEDGYSEFQQFCSEAAHQNKIAFVHTQPHIKVSPPRALNYLYETKMTLEDLEFWQVKGSDTSHSKFYTNITVLPDEAFLHSGTRPIINFRHPFLLVEAHVRAFLEDQVDVSSNQFPIERLMKLGSTLSWARIMYDWYQEHGGPLGIRPIAIDADDYLGPDKEAVMEELCKQVGLDPSCLVFTWDKAEPADLAKMPVADAQVHRTLLASTGVIPGYDSKGRTLENEMISWTAAHGEKWAFHIKDLVLQAMPDYEYLRTKRLVVPASSR